MRIKIIRPTYLSGRPLDVGEVVDATPSDARALLAAGKGVQVTDLPAPETTTAEPVAERAVKPSPVRRTVKKAAKK